ncbi:MAG: hypothetical protein K2L33_05415 [Muribaculaceae bacterium]|nr:hypothetical protein [Muribaculaceae bacterium]
MKKKTTAVWTIVGVIVLIALLLLWLTDAMSMGDTDVSAPMTFVRTLGSFADIA